MIKYYLKLKKPMTNAEMMLLKNFFKKRFNRTELKSPEFIQLMSNNFKFVRGEYDRGQAKNMADLLSANMQKNPKIINILKDAK